ncbi:hypothetical protein DO70_5104 [Burkholderia pseudomallei]|nr:hypothetical protein DO70_5104 [Burkholderia pseudomallei]
MSAGIAPQLTGTNGPRRRGLMSWRSLATISLPTPLSPTINTLARVAATFSILCNSAWIRHELPCSRLPSLLCCDMGISLSGVPRGGARTGSEANERMSEQTSVRTNGVRMRPAHFLHS